MQRAAWGHAAVPSAVGRAPLALRSSLPAKPALASSRRPRRQQQVCAVASPGGGQQQEDPEQQQQDGEKRPFPAAAAAVRRTEIQRERAAIWARIGNLVAFDADDDDKSLIDLVGDDFKEADRKNLRDVFDFERWRKHRSGNRYLRHARATFTSRIIQGLAAPLLYVTTLSTAIASWHLAAELGYVAPIPDLKIDATFGLTSFALSLLLAYRTSASYGRWDEARKMWGLVVNRSRDITRQGLGYIPDDLPELQAGLCRWVIAYSRSLMCHLRTGEDLAVELAGILPEKELKALLASTHRPNYCMQVLAEILKAARLPGWSVDNAVSTANVKASAFVRMDEHLTVFSDVTGGCERILRTPIPLSYTRHTSRFLMIWLTIMPFTLWDNCGWLMVPIATTVAFLLLGIEEIGVNVEEPFSILPLETISRTIEGNVRELEKQHGAQAAEARKSQAVGRGGAGPNGEIEAEDLVRAVVPATELKQEWGPEWELLSGTAGPAAVRVAAAR